MIFKLTFNDGRIDWITAKSQLHLIKEYDKEFDLPIQEIEDLQEISDDEAKTTMLKNTDYDEDDKEDAAEISLYDLSVGDDFQIVGCVIPTTILVIN